MSDNNDKKWWSWVFPKRPELTPEEFVDLKRSVVRRSISYLAMGFLFLFAPAFMAWLVIESGDVETAMQIFNILLPIATGVIGYWFADQRGKNNNS